MYDNTYVGVYSYIHIIVLIFVTIPVLHADSKPAPKEEVSYYNTYKNVTNDPLEKLLDEPAIKSLRTGVCNEKNLKSKQQTLADCVYKELPESDRKKILEKYMANAENKDHFESLQTTTINNKKNQAIRELEKHLFNRLQEALYGEVQEKSKKIVDHFVFYEIYKNQISKNIITSLSSYCIDADSSNHIIHQDATKREETRKTNLENLSKDFQAVQVSKNSNNKNDGPQTPKAYRVWNQCIASIQHICHKTGNYIDLKLAEEANSTDDEKDEIADNKYSKTRACVVTVAIRGLRQNLIKTVEIEENFKSLKTNKHFQEGTPTESFQRRQYTGGGNDEKSIDDLTSISSNELINTSGYREEIEKQQKILEENCLKNNNESEECQKFVNSAENAKDLYLARDEYELRTMFMKDKLAAMDREQIEKYLISEGRDPAQIEKMLEKEIDTEKIKKEINENYENERNEIIKEISAQLDRKAIKGSEIDMNIPEDKNKLEEIRKELENRPRHQKELVHFNNLVSGYLELRDEKDNIVGNNIRSIARELEDSAYSKGKKPASVQNSNSNNNSSSPQHYGEDKKDIIGNLKENIQNNNINIEETGDNNTTPLDINTINDSLLDYEHNPLKQKPDQTE